MVLVKQAIYFYFVFAIVFYLYYFVSILVQNVNQIGNKYSLKLIGFKSSP